MLIPCQRMADQDRVRRVGIEDAIGFIGDLDRREIAAAVERERPGQDDMAVEAETRISIHRRAALRGGTPPCQSNA
jgi:hypothetical protein